MKLPSSQKHHKERQNVHSTFKTIPSPTLKESACQQLDKVQLLSTTDGRSLELYCLAYSKFREAEAMEKQHGDVLLLGKNKYPQVSPYYTAMNKYADELRKWIQEFGLIPAARARCRMSVDSKNSDKWDGVLRFAK